MRFDTSCTTLTEFDLLLADVTLCKAWPPAIGRHLYPIQLGKVIPDGRVGVTRSSCHGWFGWFGWFGFGW